MITTDFKKRVFILVAPGFEEPEIIYCLAQMRQASLSVALVGSSGGRLIGWNGVSIYPDLTLDGVEPEDPPKLVVIPGGQQCATILLTDPRVHRLLNSLVEQKGRVGVMKTAVPVVRQSGLLPTLLDAHYVIQKGESLEVFVTKLVNLLLAGCNV